MMRPEDPEDPEQSQNPQPENEPQAAQEEAQREGPPPEKNPFPPEHEHLYDWVLEAEARLHQLDQEMNQPVQGPKPTLKPPGYSVQPLKPASRSRSDIQQEKDTLKAKVYQRVEKETEKAPAKAKQISRDVAFGRLYKEDIAKLAAIPKNSLSPPAAQWNINNTQVKIMAHAKAARARPQAPAQPAPAAPVRAEPAKQPTRAEPIGQTIPKPEWTAAERPAPVETPPVAEAPAPTPEVDIPTPETVTPAEPTIEPEAADIDVPGWEPER